LRRENAYIPPLPPHTSCKIVVNIHFSHVPFHTCSQFVILNTA